MPRIFLCYEVSTNPSVSGNAVWDRNFRLTLERMGCEIFFVPAELGRRARDLNDLQLRDEFTASVVATFLREHKRKPFDLAFFYLMDRMFDPGQLLAISAKGVPATNFSCNNVHQFDLVEGISRFFDLNLYAEKAAGEKFSAIGVNAMWWPMASNPEHARPLPKATIDPVASFVGARYATRLEHVHQMLVRGIDVQVYGPGWVREEVPAEPADLGRLAKARMEFGALRRTLLFYPKTESPAPEPSAGKLHQAWQDALHRDCLEHYPEAFNAPVSDRELIELYSSSAASLGFLEVFENHDPLRSRLKHMHLRDFEAPMAGALYCTDYSDELAEMFDPVKEVLAARCLDEKIDLLHFYTRNPQAGQPIRDAARRRALREHTYEHRFRQLFQALSIAFS